MSVFKRLFSTVMCVCMLVWLAACSFTAFPETAKDVGHYVQLTPEQGFNLPGWTYPKGKATLNYMQSLEVIRKDGGGQLRVMLAMDENKLDFLAFDDIGRRALQLQWTAQDVWEQRAAWLPLALNGADVLGYIMLAFQRPQDIRPSLNAAGFQLLVGKGFREISGKDGRILRIEYASPDGESQELQVEVIHLVYDFILRIRSVEVSS